MAKTLFSRGTDFELSNISKYLYQGHTVPQITRKYIDGLKQSAYIPDLEHANKLEEYWSMWTDEKFYRRITKISSDVFKQLSLVPDLTFWFEGRRKSLISSDIKILTYQKKDIPLDQVRDFFGFRIILLNTPDTMENIYRCYSIMEKIIKFATQEGFIPCSHEPRIDTVGFDSLAHNIIIPNNDDISNFFKYNSLVKDYILYPKENGYQSLHVILRDPKSCRCFEIQIRTLDMHMYAESGLAGHTKYKDQKYSEYNISFDRSKIHLMGYCVSPEGEIFDFAGLEKSQLIFQRAKTF